MTRKTRWIVVFLLLLCLGLGTFYFMQRLSMFWRTASLRTPSMAAWIHTPYVSSGSVLRLDVGLQERDAKRLRGFSVLDDMQPLMIREAKKAWGPNLSVVQKPTLRQSTPLRRERSALAPRRTKVTLPIRPRPAVRRRASSSMASSQPSPQASSRIAARSTSRATSRTTTKSVQQRSMQSTHRGLAQVRHEPRLKRMEKRRPTPRTRMKIGRESHSFQLYPAIRRHFQLQVKMPTNLPYKGTLSLTLLVHLANPEPRQGSSALVVSSTIVKRMPFRLRLFAPGQRMLWRALQCGRALTAFVFVLFLMLGLTRWLALRLSSGGSISDYNALIFGFGLFFMLASSYFSLRDFSLPLVIATGWSAGGAIALWTVVWHVVLFSTLWYLLLAKPASVARIRPITSASVAKERLVWMNELQQSLEPETQSSEPSTIREELATSSRVKASAATPETLEQAKAEANKKNKAKGEQKKGRKPSRRKKKKRR